MKCLIYISYPMSYDVKIKTTSSYLLEVEYIDIIFNYDFITSNKELNGAP